MAQRTEPLTIIFGGTFDPPHRAHVALPLEVMRKTGANEVLYVLAAQPPLKPKSPGATAAERLTMLHLALRDFPEATIVTDELDRAATGKPSYTIDTLETLRHRLGPDRRMRLLIGTDQMLQFHRWQSWQRIIELAEPLVMLRAPLKREDVLAALTAEDLPMAWRSRLIEVTPIETSSTLVRNKLAAGESPSQLLDLQIECYIRTRGLYGPARPTRPHAP